MVHVVPLVFFTLIRVYTLPAPDSGASGEPESDPALHGTGPLFTVGEGAPPEGAGPGPGPWPLPVAVVGGITVLPPVEPARFEVVVLRRVDVVVDDRDDRVDEDEADDEVEEPDATTSAFGVLALQAPEIPPMSASNAMNVPFRQFAMLRTLDGNVRATR